MFRSLISCGVAALFSIILSQPVEAGEEPVKKGTAEPAEAAREGRNSVYLGVFTVPLSGVGNRVKQSLRINDDDGVAVAEVLPNSPAEEAGLREKDVITHVNGNAIADQAALCEELNRLGAGSKARLTILRRGEKREIVARLQETTTEVITFLPYAGPATGTVPSEEHPVVRQSKRRIRELEQEVARLEKRLRQMEELQLTGKR
jgi:membrane-associated protease RseP (regulator of RpoE activity)